MVDDLKEPISPKWRIPVALVIGVALGTFLMSAIQSARIEAIEVKESATEQKATDLKLECDVADRSLNTRIDALKSEYDLLHKEVTDARLMRAERPE